jgi:hypothetical protein
MRPAQTRETEAVDLLGIFGVQEAGLPSTVMMEQQLTSSAYACTLTQGQLRPQESCE